MKPRLIILSDLWGIQKSNWIKAYTKRLNKKFYIRYYDCCEIGKIDISVYNQEVLHNQFINGGIEVATKRLLELEKGKISILAFSIGGVIAWKAGLNGLKIENLYAISSTRLRNETKKPNGNLNIYFGSKDKYKPKNDWHKNLIISNRTIKNKNHEMYKENEFAGEICKEINIASC